MKNEIEIRSPAIRSIRPGRLRGMSETQMEKALEHLFACPVEVEDGTIRIYCVDAYDSPRLLQKHAQARLGHVGRVTYACRAGQAFVQLELNDVARRVIGLTNENALETEE